jgi:hypothetical protein
MKEKTPARELYDIDRRLAGREKKRENAKRRADGTYIKPTRRRKKKKLPPDETGLTDLGYGGGGLTEIRGPETGNEAEGDRID